MAEQSASASACDGRAVVRTARFGLITIIVAVLVAALTLAGAGAVLLASGFIPLSGLEGRIARAIEERLGPNWTVTAGAAEINREDGRSKLRVRQVAFRHAGGASFRAPDAVLGYDPLALLRGDLRIVSIDLRGLNVRLGIDRDGALVLDADADALARGVPIQRPAPIADASTWQAFSGVMAGLAVLTEGEGLLGALESAGLSGATLALTAPDGREKAALADVDVRLTRPAAGVTRLTMRGRTGSRWKEMALDLTVAADGSRRAELDIRRFEPAEAAELAFGDAAVKLSGLSLSGKVTLLQAADGQRSVEGTLRVGAGRVAVPQPNLDPVAIDHATVGFSSTDGLRTLAIRESEIVAGGTRLTGGGTLTETGPGWTLAWRGSGTVAGAGQDRPVVIDELSADLVADPAAGEVTIAGLSVKGPAINAGMKGWLRRRGEAESQRLEIRAVDSQARAIIAVWPAFTSPELHDMLTRQLDAGLVRQAEMKLDLSEEGSAMARGGGGMPDQAVAAQWQMSGVHFRPSPGLPALSDGEISGVATGRSVGLAIASARADLGGDRVIALSDASFGMGELWVKRAPAKVAFRATGSADALNALFAFPALKEVTLVPVEPVPVRGAFDLRTTLHLPLVADLAPSDIQVQSAGTLSNVASDTLLGGERLDGGNFTVSFERGTLAVKGEARVGGDRGTIELRQGPKGAGEATLSLTLDNAARQRRGIGAELGVTGPVQVKVTKLLGKGPTPAPRVEIDLARAAIDGILPGWTKPAGRPGKLAFAYTAAKDGVTLDDLVLDAGPVQARGRLVLDGKYAFEAAALTQLRLSPGDDLRVDASRDGAVLKLTVRGPVADARPFIRLVNEEGASGKTSSGRGQPGADLDLDLAVPILTGFNSEVIGNAVLKLSRRGGVTRSASFDGRIGKAPVSLRQPAGGPGLVQAADGGALLRYLDLYRRAHGGDLVLRTEEAGGRQRGELLLRNFVVRDEPALRRVIAAQPATGPDGAAERTGPAGGRPESARVEFTKLRAEFSRDAGRLDIADAVIWGNQVGFTVQGSVDLARDRVDIGGTFVPGYAFNNAFAQVPVVGLILGGGQYGGLFAVNFRIAGSASAPTMTVNPLSALAPGILRRFVDPLGGGPLDRSGGVPPPVRGGAER